MRKKISLLLSWAMIWTTCIVNPTYGADDKKVELKYIPETAIVETDKGLNDNYAISKSAEEALLEWSVDKGAGNYELSYYSDSINDNVGDTTKITLNFEVGKDINGADKPEKAVVTAKMEKSDGQPITFSAYQSLYPYKGEFTNQQNSITAYKAELSLPINGGTIANSAKELSLHLGKNLKVRILTSGSTIKLWTDQINKGYITDFTLKYDGNVQDTAIVFPGIADAEISSIHLEKQHGLNDRTELINASGNPMEIAGSHPGVKVRFARPLIRKGNKFEPISGNLGKNVNATLNIQTKLEPDNAVSTNQALVSFNLADNQLEGSFLQQNENNKKEQKSMEESGNYLNLYLVKDMDYVDSSVSKHVLEWQALEESMVIGGELTLSGNVDIAGTTYNISTGNSAIKTGYTYLKYTPEQSNPGEVTLQITPYKYKGEVVYQVYSINGKAPIDVDSNANHSLFGSYKFTYDPQYPDRKLEISMPTGTEATFRIKAILSKETSSAISQNVYYDVNGDGVIVKPYTPQIREVNGIYVIPEGETGVEAAGLGVVWSAPSEAKLKESLSKNKALYYELSLYDKDKGNQAVIAVFQLRLRKQGEDTKNDPFIIEQLGNPDVDISYDRGKNQFVARKVVLKDIEKADWENIKFKDGYENEMTYPTDVETYYKEGLTYTIPNSFYLGMRTVLEADTGLKVSATSSELYPFTLDKTNEVVPVPSVFSVDKKTNTTDLVFNFENVSVSNFTDSMLTPAHWILKGSDHNKTLPGSYEVYLYQANYIQDGTNKKNDITDGEFSKIVEDDTSDKMYVIRDTLTTTPMEIKFSEDEQAMSALRSGKVVKFIVNNADLKGGNNAIQFKGLDPNQAYYIRVRTVLESERTKNGEQQQRTDKSLLSKNYGFTTSMASKPVEPDEEVPPTPKDYTAMARDNSTAVLHWKDPDLTIGSAEDISYEIIRTTEQKLSADALKRSNKASDIIASETGKSAVLFDSSHYNKVDIEGNETYELIDDTLQPNTVYYYYIRTIYKGIYSEWIYQPVTTMNIEKPISLKAFNATKETVDISFLAKVPEEALYGTYDFGIAIQSEEDPEWQTVLASSLRTISVTDKQVQDGYNFYAYRITGLKPGKRYNIKVCVIDKTKDKIDGQYQQSLYSNIVYIRTEYDQEQQDKEDKYKEYLDKFDKEVEKLKKKPYWTVKEDAVYKYRTDYLNADMGLNKEYTLVSGTNSSEAYYYLPAEVLTQFNEGSTILKVKLGNQEVDIRPETIKDDHELIEEAQQLIDENRLEDYYLGISVKKSNYTYKINNETPVSPRITIEMSLVYMRQEDVLTEADILEALDDIISDKRKDFIDELERKIDKGKIGDDELQAIIDDYLEKITDKHMDKVDRIISRETRKLESIQNIDRSILILSEGDQTGVNGYYYNTNGWMSVETYSTGNLFGIEASKLGTYIFTGQISLVDTVPEIAPYQSFINKYQLTEFFKMDSYYLKTAVTKEQLYGALARVMGAKQGTDYITYLKQQGILGITNVGIKTSIRQDQAIYAIMQGYEKLHHQKVTAIIVNNKQAVQNIGAFQPVYRNYVYGAVALKVVIPDNSRIMPSKQMTGLEVISMLYKIQ